MTDADMLRRAAALLDGSGSEVLPTAALSADQFEAFTERLLAACRHALPSEERRIGRIERWGRSGDKQDGIDLAGVWSDGTTLAVQCKRLAKLQPAQVRRIITETTYRAEEFKLVYSGVASAPARAALDDFPAWELWDARSLRQILDTLPLHLRRQVLDETWSLGIRRRVLRGLPTDAFITTGAVRASRARSGQLLDDSAPFVGMNAQRRKVTELLQSGAERTAAVIVHGPGGTGKTRLISEAVGAFERLRPDVPVLWLGPGATPTGDALEELPLEPSVIVIDDAHLDASGLQALLRHVVETPGVRLILGSRDPAVPELRRKLLRAGISEGKIASVQTVRISLKAARKLLNALTADVSVSHGFKEALARLATDTPAIAVLAVGMIRAGTLSYPFPLDRQLREEVLARFGAETLDDVVGAPVGAPRRLLSIVATLGVLDCNDDTSQARVLAMTGWTAPQYLSTFAALESRGLVEGTQGVFRVAAEMLADQVVESEAVIFDHDSGFVSTLWQHFGGNPSRTLVANLASFAWRLDLQNKPRVTDTVWSEVRDRVVRMNHLELAMFLSDAAQLAVTQPAELARILDVALRHLDHIDDAADGEYLGTWSSRAGMRRQIGSLYADAGVNEPVLVAHVLEMLWTLGQRDDRPENTTPDHPFRLIRERFADYATLSSGEAPDQVIDAVERWIGDEPTPIPLLMPLMAKHGSRTEMTSHRALVFHPFIVSAEKTAVLRDRVRALLERHLDHPRESVELLQAALAPPRPGFGVKVTDEHVLAWEADDLATVATLRFVADHARTSAVRRLVRSAVDWTAAQATSAKVRTAALALIIELDRRTGDDFADLLVGTMYFTPHRRLGPNAAVGRGADRYDRLDTLFDQIVTDVWPSEFTQEGFTFLDTQIREASDVGARHLWMIDRLASAMQGQSPHLVPQVTAAIIRQSPGPLDNLLPQLLLGTSEEELQAMTHAYAGFRPGVRLAFGRAATSGAWRASRPSAGPLLLAGRLDDDIDVRQAFLCAYDSNARLAVMAKELVAGGATEATIDFVLNKRGFSPADDDALPEVGAEDVADLLGLLDRMADNALTVAPIIRAVARIDLAATLTCLNRPGDGCFNPDVPTLVHYDAGDIARWLVLEAENGEVRPVNWATAKFVGEPMPHDVAAVLSTEVAHLDAAAVDRLTEILSGFSGWASHHPELARRLLEHENDELPARQLRRAFLQNAVTPSSWSTGSEGSPELSRSIFAAKDAAAREPNAELREMLEGGVRSMQAWLREEHDNDNDNDDDDEPPELTTDGELPGPVG